jgi:hypothetical protein
MVIRGDTKTGKRPKVGCPVCGKEIELGQLLLCKQCSEDLTIKPDETAEDYFKRIEHYYG